MNWIVVEDAKNWPKKLQNATVVSARAYLAGEGLPDDQRVRVYNLCQSFRYQSLGYYVSLLAEARGHRPVPSISTIQDLSSLTIVRSIASDLQDVLTRSLKGIKSDEFTLSIYFGTNVARTHELLARHLFNLFPMPLLRARFGWNGEAWTIQSVRPIALRDVPREHEAFLHEAAQTYFAGKLPRSASRKRPRFSLAILEEPEARDKPSDERAIQRFVKAGQKAGFAVSRITKDDYGRLLEFDALFIRATTWVTHYTYRFSRRAAAEGLVVIDDPQSILRCTNKVFLAEVLERHKVGVPTTRVIHRGNVEEAVQELGLPCVLKAPDSSFSRGVKKVSTAEEYHEKAAEFLEESDLILGQSFVPTDYDWRIGVLDGRPLYACRYHMAKGHWQIVRHDGKDSRFGKNESVPLWEVPKVVLKTAVRSANLIGRGLYGVDLKQVGREVYVIEVNDNPNVDAGFEDHELGDELYERIMDVFLRRVEERLS